MKLSNTGLAVAVTLTGIGSAALAQAAGPQQIAPAVAPVQRLTAAPAAPPPILQASVSYTRIEVVLGETLAVARGGLVTLGMQYRPPAVASVQVPGTLSYPIGPFPGGFDHSIANADIRALLKKDEAQIFDRCRATLDYNKADVLNTVHDTTIALTLNNADGTAVASTNVPYQLGLTCKRPLIAKIAYVKIAVDIGKPLSHATGGAASIALTYNGTGQVAAVQPGAIAYPLGARQGPFEQTLPNADIRAVLQRDEAAILGRCKQTLEYNKGTVLDTVHDTQIPVIAIAADGTVVASTSVPYQLGLTCRR